MNGPIEGTPTVVRKHTHTHTHTHIHKTNNLIWRRKNGLLHQSDPSKQLCFIFDLIVSPLTATFINSSNGQSEVGRVSALILSPSPPLHSQYDRLVLYFIKMLLPNGRAEVEERREEGNKGDWEASHFRERERERKSGIYAFDERMKTNTKAGWEPFFSLFRRGNFLWYFFFFFNSLSPFFKPMPLPSVSPSSSHSLPPSSPHSCKL